MALVPLKYLGQDQKQNQIYIQDLIILYKNMLTQIIVISLELIVKIGRNKVQKVVKSYFLHMK